MKTLVKFFLSLFVLFSSLNSASAIPSPPPSSMLIFIPPIIAAANKADISTYWGASAYLSCPSSALTFTVSAEGVSKSSVCQPGQCVNNVYGTFDGWVGTIPGQKTFTYSMTSACGSDSMQEVQTLEEGKTYRFVLQWDYSIDSPAVFVYTTTGAPTTPRFGIGPMTNGRLDATDPIWEKVDEIPLNIPNANFTINN